MALGDIGVFGRCGHRSSGLDPRSRAGFTKPALSSADVSAGPLSGLHFGGPREGRPLESIATFFPMKPGLGR